MANVRVQWALPTTRTSGRPLDPSEIQYVSLEVSADGGVNFAPIGAFPPDVLSTDVTDLDFGTYTFRGIVVDKSDPPRFSTPMVATWVNADTSDPSPLVTLEVVQL